MKKFVSHFFKDKSGATAIEYGMIAGLISVACIVGMTLVGNQLLAIYTGLIAAMAPAF